jgi:anti-sigma factor RsiW
LPAGQAKQVELHLGTCPACRSELAELQHISAIVAPLTHLQDTEQFVQRVLARLPEPPMSLWEQVSGWWRVPAFAFAALAIMFMGPSLVESKPTSLEVLCSASDDSSVAALCDDSVEPDELMNLMWSES